MFDFNKLKKEIEDSQRPLFFFDDDQDGLCSFLLLYKHINKGKGIVVKSTPIVDSKYEDISLNYYPDKVFVLDLAEVTQDFIDKVNVPVVWVDHHTPLKREKVIYFNPRNEKSDIYYPTSLIAYNALKENLWIAMIGIVGDWLVPDFLEEYRKEYPDLIKYFKDIEDITFKTKLGKLIHIFSMILKGPTQKVMQCVKVLTRINSPYEILNQTTPAGKYIYKTHEIYNQKFEELLKEANKVKDDDDILLVFIYYSDKISFTPDLAKHLINKFPKKVVIVAREKSGEMKISFRSKKYSIDLALKEAMKGFHGKGGGHEYACGGNIKRKEFKEFLIKFKENIINQNKHS